MTNTERWGRPRLQAVVQGHWTADTCTIPCPLGGCC